MSDCFLLIQPCVTYLASGAKELASAFCREAANSCAEEIKPYALVGAAAAFAGAGLLFYFRQRNAPELSKNTVQNQSVNKPRRKP